MCYFYRPKRSFGQGNIFTPVCHSVHRGGLARRPPRLDEEPPLPPAGWRTHPPWMEGEPPQLEGEPPLAGRRTPRLEGEPPQLEGEPPQLEGEPPPLAGWRTPPWLDGEPPDPPPPPGSRLRHTVYDRPVRILLECILVG